MLSWPLIRLSTSNWQTAQRNLEMMVKSAQGTWNIFEDLHPISFQSQGSLYFLKELGILQIAKLRHID